MQPCILITGGAGFIGCEIAQRLAGDGRQIVAVDNLLPQIHPLQTRPAALPDAVRLEVADIRDPAFWDEFLKAYRPEVVYHLAAETGTGQSLLASERHASVNVLGLAVTLDALARHEAFPRQIVLSSSRAIYGEGAWSDGISAPFYPGLRPHDMLALGQWDFTGPSGLPARPLPHDAATTVANPTSIYGATKLAQEHILKSWAGAMSVRLSILRFQNVYGPGQSPFNPYTGIITLFHRQARAGMAIDVYEDGNIGRDFVFISDVADACVRILRDAAPMLETIDIGSGVVTTIREAADVIAAYHGAPAPQVSGKFRDGDVRWAVADLAGAAAAIGYASRVSFEEGSRAVAEWLLANGHI